MAKSSFPEELRGEIGEKGMQGPRSFVGPCSADCYPGCPCGNWVIAPKTIADLPYEERRQYVKKIEITDGVSTETYKDGSHLSGPIGPSGGIGPVGVAPDLTPDYLKEESDMLKHLVGADFVKKLREFFVDPFAKFNRNRIPTVKTHGSVTGRCPHRAENAGLQRQAADDIQAAILAAYVNSPHTTVVFDPTTILTDDDLSDLDGRAKQVVDMANSGLEPVRETSSFWDATNAIDRDTDARTSTPVEDSAPSYASRSADEDRSAAAAVESRDTSSYESSSSSSSDSNSYSSSSSDSSYSSSSDSGSSYSVD